MKRLRRKKTNYQYIFPAQSPNREASSASKATATLLLPPGDIHVTIAQASPKPTKPNSRRAGPTPGREDNARAGLDASLATSLRDGRWGPPG
jgi:hypothetical protein